MTAKKKLSVLDLFCGCGGLSHGFAQAGYDIALGIDNDKQAIETFRATHPNANSICCDIRQLSSGDLVSNLPKRGVDVVIGGPPCQGLSLSGSRKLNDDRNSLYKKFIDVVKMLNPKAVLIENVPGIASLYKGVVKDNILQSLQKLGYSVKFEILRASDFGVPQHRRRIFFVGLKDADFNFPMPTHFSDKEQSPSRQTMITCHDAISDLPLLDEDLGSISQAYHVKPTNKYQALMRLNSSDIRNHIAAKHSDRIKKIISLVPAGGNYKTLPPKYRSTRNFHVAWTRFPDRQPAPTIDTGHRHHFHYSANRVPTVRECARLQSFPDSFVFVGNKTEQFRQVGNAVPPILAKALAESLKEII